MRLTEPPAARARCGRGRLAPAVQAVMDQALQRDATLRYASANDFGRAFRPPCKGSPTATRSGNTRCWTSRAWVPPTRVSETPAPANAARRMGRPGRAWPPSP